MRKSVVLASMMAMALGAAGAQAGGGYTSNATYTSTATAAPVATTTSGTVVLTDVPAGHWAREAVETTVKAGLIEGFPDGTFRGNENLTRYQAAMIFHRLLQSGALSSGSVSDADLVVITKGMQEVSTELAAISSRLTDVERLTVDQQSRIDALEASIANLDVNVDVTALTARIDALEARVNALQSTPTTPVVTEPAPVVPAPTDTTTDVVVIGDPVVTTPEATPTNMYVGIAGSFNPTYSDLSNSANNYRRCLNGLNLGNKDTNTTNERTDYCAGIAGVIGTNSLYGPVGARATVEYIPGREAIAADINAMAGLDLGLIQPYAGAGVGVVYGTGAGKPVVGSMGSESDFYANGIVGADFRVTPTIGIFAEGNGKYYFGDTRNTEAAATQVSEAGGNFGIGAKAGIKLFF